MDRFIDAMQSNLSPHRSCLKSNMDRFIDYKVDIDHYIIQGLKSNMDRFIGYVKISESDSNKV